ncbi:MAG TPA: alcohol dehydrogenase catalytic domain-containing protein [Ktedonobacterales bacterium]|nr:alcohol dehydrogenase catalytic domain-containing protein [Ktedonobacterales bacterium]
MRRHSLLTAPHRLEWAADDLPPPAPDEVLVRTIAGAVSIGAELPQYRGDEREVIPRGYPRMTGYESLGIVQACGANVRRLAVGQRVLAFYGHRTYGVVAEAKSIPMPDDVPDALALLAILSCDAAKGVRKLAPAPDDAALVMGGGTMGLLTLFILTRYGVRTVDVVEPRPERQTLALSLGARRVVAPDALPDDATYTAGFECSSRAAAFTLLQERMRPGGHICVLADGNIEPLTLAPAFHANELSIIGSSDGWDYQQHAVWYVEQVRRGATSGLERLFELAVAPEELPALFERMARGEIVPMKVLVRYRETQ